MNDVPLAVGVDIGGTKLAVAVVSRDGRVLSRVVLPTEAELGFDRAVQRLGDAIVTVLDQAGATEQCLAGVGIGCAGPVDPTRGLINNPFTLTGWDRCDIVTPLASRFRVPVRLENDADAAALGECFAGAGRGCDPVAMLTFGTGVGGAVVASGTAVGEAARAAGFADSKAVFAASRAGNPAARAIVDRALRASATAAWTLFHTFLPHRLILGGGVMDREFDLYVGAMRSKLAGATQFTRGICEIVRAELGNDAGVIGAASLVQAGRPPGG